MSIDVIKMGKWQTPTNSVKNLRKHVHEDFYQLIFAQNSVGKLVYDSSVLSYKPEHLYFTPPGVWHTCANKRNTQYIIVFFKILDTRLAKLIDSLPPELAPHDLMSCKHLLSQSAYEFSSDSELGRLRANAYFELFLSASLDRAPMSVFASETGNASVSAMGDSGIDRAANYIYNNFSNELSIDALVNISNFERRQFFRRFKEKFQTTPSKYINELRMSKAKTLLANTDTPINEISTYCGFKTEHYFSRAFKAYEGISPNEYRKNEAAERKKEIVF